MLNLGLRRRLWGSRSGLDHPEGLTRGIEVLGSFGGDLFGCCPVSALDSQLGFQLGDLHLELMDALTFWLSGLSGRALGAL